MRIQNAMTALVCAAAAGLPACAQTGEPAGSGVHATPEHTGVEGEPRSWRRVFPGGEAGERLRDLMAVVRNDASIDDVFHEDFFEHTPREKLEENLTQMRVASGGLLGFVRVLREGERSLGVEMVDLGREPWVAQLEWAPGGGGLTMLTVSKQPERPEGAKVYDTWEEVLSDARALEGEVSLSVRTLGAPEPGKVFARLAEGRVRNIGQVSQLFVFGALAEAVDAGELSWSDEVAMHAGLRSLPPSQYAEARDGRAHTLDEYIIGAGALRDTAAADAVLSAVGRERVVDYYTSIVADAPAKALPWLSMRDFALLKLFSSDEGRAGYASADTGARRETLAGVPDDADLSLNQRERLAAWRSPRAIDRIGWFASASDLMDLLADLREKAENPGLEPLARALVAKGTITLRPEAWPTSVVKTGGEPGVFAGAWMMRRYDGAWYGAVLIVNDDEGDVDAQEATRILSGVADLLTLMD